MIGLDILFWIFVIQFAIIGVIRGWAKELLVSFSVILGLFIITVLEIFIPFIHESLVNGPVTPLFWLRAVIIAALVFFGYQSPNIARLAATNRFARERFQDALLGLFLGALNGYLIFGSIWFYLNQAAYPFPFITAPVPGSASGDAALRLLTLLPPELLGTPAIYFAVAIAFAFVLVVFI
ncbi:MAG: hypothetical protein GYA17_06910 [Chloroflexi bacterium]|jgi:uncharacterized membrane protein required for colicin V production|nr:hypothetical protein [Anaerolineaceae bacterium]NMB88071.1 hypothetical protein [Chloroflexota bacterium]